jgi:hypothetical protein
MALFVLALKLNTTVFDGGIFQLYFSVKLLFRNRKNTTTFVL